jgi:hypothetical protein
MEVELVPFVEEEESNALSFRWAMGGRVYTKTGDGYYYDLEGVK